jgi:ATP-dependent DNA helicase DinG
MEGTAGSRTLNFFPDGRTPRAEQKAAIVDIESRFRSGGKFVAFQGPTGSGKSFVGMSFAREAAAMGQRTHLITAQKFLQDQYTTDFRPPLVEVMKGRSNYRCSYDALSKNAARGYCRRVEKAALIPECLRSGTMEEALAFELPPEAHACDYWAQMMRAMGAPVTLFNFQSFLFQQRLGRFGARDLMVLDEAHNAESVLLGFVQVVISDKVLQRLGIRLDLRLKTPEDVIAWLDREQVDEVIRMSLGGENGEGVAAGFSPEETDRLRSLLDRIADLRKYLDLTEWVVDVTEEGDEEDPKDRTRKLRVRPVFVSLFARELLFSKADRVLAMSATILDPKIWARNLGISPREVGYVQSPCVFPIKNRPIIPEYAGDMSWKQLDNTLPKVWPTIARILDRHKGQRGIIHSHSDLLCRQIVEHIRSPRFVHLDMFPTRDKTALLKQHLARPDSVIVASAMHEGLDLKDDLGRFSIITKMPWPAMGDALVKARMVSDKTYLPYQAALKLTQSYGRCVRHMEDWAITYVTDAGFDSFLSRCGWLMPKWFTDAVQRPPRKPTTTVPLARP